MPIELAFHAQTALTRALAANSDNRFTRRFSDNFPRSRLPGPDAARAAEGSPAIEIGLRIQNRCAGKAPRAIGSRLDSLRRTCSRSRCRFLRTICRPNSNPSEHGTKSGARHLEDRSGWADGHRGLARTTRLRSRV